MDIFARRHRRRPLELQLTAMIDIFSMIVIFLILGTVFGASEVVIPPDLLLPRSVSKEGVDSAPRVVIHQDKVTTSLGEAALGVELFRGASVGTHPSVAAVREKIKAYIKSASSEAKGSAMLLNVIADQDTPYQDIFDVVRFFREEGFNTLLFVATGEGKAP